MSIVYTRSKPTYMQHMFAVCAFFYSELDYCESWKLLWTASGTTDYTILSIKHSWLKWLRHKYNTERNKGLGLGYSSHNARSNEKAADNFPALKA